MSVLDKIGMGPRREEFPQPDESCIIRVTRNAVFGKQLTVEVHLSLPQFMRYKQWRAGSGLIQDYLGDLPVVEREKLQSGLTEEEQSAVFDRPGEEE